MRRHAELLARTVCEKKLGSQTEDPMNREVAVTVEQVHELVEHALGLIERVLESAAQRPHLAARGTTADEASGRVGYGRLLAMLSAQGYRSLRSMLLLQRDRMTIDSLLHFRQLLEMYFNVSYVKGDPVARTKLFQDHSLVIRKKLSNSIVRLPDDHSLRATLARYVLADSDPKEEQNSATPGKRRDAAKSPGWYDMSVQQRAEAANAQDLYDFFYRPASDVMHANIAGLQKTSRMDSGRTLVLNLDEDPEHGIPWLLRGIACAMAILALFDKEASLGFEQELETFAMVCRQQDGS